MFFCPYTRVLCFLALKLIKITGVKVLILKFFLFGLTTIFDYHFLPLLFEIMPKTESKIL